MIVIVKTLLFVSVVASVWLPLHMALADPPDVKIRMQHDVQRSIAVIADYDGSITLAAESLQGEYAESQGVNVMHDATSPADRASCLYCVCNLAIAAIREGDESGLLALFEPRAKLGDLSGYFARDEAGHAVASWPQYSRLFPKEVVYSAGAARVGVFARRQDGVEFGVGAFTALRDEDTGHWLLTTRFRTEQFPVGKRVGKVIEADRLAGMGVFRLRYRGKFTKSSIEVTMEPLSPKAEIAQDDLLIYIRTEVIPSGDTPLLILDPETLDPATREVQEALRAQLLWIHDDSSASRLIECFTQASQKKVEEYIIHHRVPGGPKRSFISAPGIEADLLLTELRFSTRVRVGTGYVWFGWAPRSGLNSGPNDTALITLHQVRTADGSWKMLLDSFDDTDPAANYARRLLDSDMHMCEAITRKNREKHLYSP